MDEGQMEVWLEEMFGEGTVEQRDRIREVREGCRGLARVVYRNVGEGRERERAMRLVYEVLVAARAGIEREGR